MDANQSFIVNQDLDPKLVKDINEVSSPVNSLCVIISISLSKWLFDGTSTMFNMSDDDDMLSDYQFDAILDERFLLPENVTQWLMYEEAMLNGVGITPAYFEFNGTIMFTDTVINNTCIILRSQSWMVEFHDIYSYVCFTAIFIGNILVLFLPLVEKSFRSPVFITLQSLSVISILYGILLLIVGHFSINCMDLQDPQCAVISGLSFFTLYIYLFHLSILATQRIYVILFPLKALIHHTKKNVRFVLITVYLVGFSYQLIMYTLGIISCNSQSSVIESNLEPIIMNGLTSIFVITAFVVSIIKARVSKNLQNGSQRKQSRLASIVIMIYMILYLPSVCVHQLLINSCAGMLFTDLVYLFSRMFQLFILCINPLILCLRTKEARRALMSVKFRA